MAGHLPQPRGAQFWFGISLAAVAVQWLLLRGAILSALRVDRRLHE